MEWISKEEVLNVLGEDYEPVIKEIKVAEEHKDKNILNTPSVTHNTPMEIARKYKRCMRYSLWIILKNKR